MKLSATLEMRHGGVRLLVWYSSEADHRCSVNEKTIMRRISVIMAVICLQGCATGPVRYKTLGRYEYATVEWTKRSPVAAKPFVAVAGIITDVGIGVTDTIFTPVVSVPIAAKGAFFGPCSASRNFTKNPVEETFISLLFFPFWFPPAYSLSMYFQTYEPPGSPYFDVVYPGTWGDESALFKEKPIRRIAPRP